MDGLAHAHPGRPRPPWAETRPRPGGRFAVPPASRLGKGSLCEGTVPAPLLSSGPSHPQASHSCPRLSYPPPPQEGEQGSSEGPCGEGQPLPPGTSCGPSGGWGGLAAAGFLSQEVGGRGGQGSLLPPRAERFSDSANSEDPQTGSHAGPRRPTSEGAFLRAPGGRRGEPGGAVAVCPRPAVAVGGRKPHRSYSACETSALDGAKWPRGQKLMRAPGPQGRGRGASSGASLVRGFSGTAGRPRGVREPHRSQRIPKCRALVAVSTRRNPPEWARPR